MVGVRAGQSCNRADRAAPSRMVRDIRRVHDHDTVSDAKLIQVELLRVHNGYRRAFS
jgi:hypothetical protein